MNSLLKTELLPHQTKTLEFAIRTKYYGDFSVMGTGKSLSAIALIAKVGKKAVVVCPPHLVNNWLNEFKKHSHLRASPHYLYFDKDADVSVIPYTRLDQAEDVFKNIQVIIADEGHYLKNLEAKRTRNFHNLFYKYKPEYFGYLSGTPIKNRIPEIYSMLVLFSHGPNSPKILDSYKSFYTFCCKFTLLKQTQYGTKFEGMKNVEELRKFINPFTIRHSDELLNLPELTESNVIVKFEANKELESEWNKYLETGISIGSKAKAESALAKCKFTADHVCQMVDEGLGPIIVFSDHIKPLEKMELELSTLRVKKITGEITDRDKIIDMLNRGQLDVLLCSIGAASSGYNFTSSSVLVFNDPAWSASDMDQAKKRIHRIGSTKPCRIINVVGSSVDEYIYKMLSSKNKVINKVIKYR